MFSSLCEFFSSPEIDSEFDPIAGTVTFTTNHLSFFVIGTGAPVVEEVAVIPEAPQAPDTPDPAPADTQPAIPPTATEAPAPRNGGGMLRWILGGIAAAGGIGTLAVVLVRRRR